MRCIPPLYTYIHTYRPRHVSEKRGWCRKHHLYYKFSTTLHIDDLRAHLAKYEMTQECLIYVYNDVQSYSPGGLEEVSRRCTFVSAFLRKYERSHDRDTLHACITRYEATKRCLIHMSNKVHSYKTVALREVGHRRDIVPILACFHVLRAPTWRFRYVPVGNRLLRFDQRAPRGK